MSMQLIQHIELVSAQKSITFNSIPQTGFTDLFIFYSTRSDRSAIDDPINITYNGTSSGYSTISAIGAGSGNGYIETYGTSVTFGGYMPGASTTANTFGSGSIYITNYRVSASKSISLEFVAENNATTSYQNLTSSLWSNNAAISSLSVTAQVGNLVAGSSATLFGITSGSSNGVTVS